MSMFFRKNRFECRSTRTATAFAVLSLAVVCSPAKAQDPIKEVHDDLVLTTAAPENLGIHITYFQSDLGKETPVVVLLHAEGSNRQVWLGKGKFAERLWNQGYAVIAVDFRKHGQSVVEGPGVNNKIGPRDRQAMVALDMEAVKNFIFKEHTAKRLNMNKLGIIAPEMGAAVAVLFTVRDWSKRPYDDGVKTPKGQDVRTLILLSPDDNPRGLSTGSQLAFIGRLAANKNQAAQFSTLFLYGKADKKEKRSGTSRMYKKVVSKVNKERVLIHDYPFKYRGVELVGINNPRTKCEEHMLGFLDKHLKKLTMKEWVDRRSVFDRN